MTAPPTVPPDAVERYLSAAVVGDLGGALAVVDELVAASCPLELVVEDLLAVAQGRVGDAGPQTVWGSPRSTGDGDHGDGPPRRRHPRPAVARCGRVAGQAAVYVVCCEGEWHTLPARMAVEVLTLQGFTASLVGPSLPATEVTAFLGEDPPPVVLVACALTRNLVGAWRTVSAVRAAGARTVCGGPGFGRGGVWAGAVGATTGLVVHRRGSGRSPAGWSSRARCRAHRPARAPATRSTRPGGAAGPVADLERAVHDIAARYGRHPLWGGQGEDMTPVLGAVCSATLVDDATVVTDFVAWLESVNAARGLPLVTVAAAFQTLVDLLPASCPSVRAMAAAGAAACTQPLR